MKFHDTKFEGAWLIELDRRADARGAFGRTFCVDEFAARGLDSRVAQCSLSINHRTGTLRGIHFQSAPHAEAKLVRVQRGAIWDVIVDLRKGSSTFASWYGVPLTSENALALYIPEGFGHGFITLTDDSEVFYQISVRYMPQHSNGIRWDDPDIRIAWPIPPASISDKDLALPFLKEAIL